ncbi:MBL fold metallo-hydrolase [Enterococcus sp. 669A]|uniref:MBL fold metallo-hydrolase n=1 Tax=Candidatus Enterococcus moelleringii TaxID=2815325 RepID=A0ABS3LBN4_9ENTE|nr:MBL fold metallo-hydrolase [Enterococcus sp. 669A]MBO1307044.1 MBL fold metallo-hydrolase [Enterococcus sp. 669A]
MLHIEGLVTGRAQENCYLIYNEDNLLIVDPGSEGDRIAKKIEQTGRKPAAILLTHTHYDHIGAVEQLRNLYHVPVYVSALEQEWLGNPVYNLSGLGSHQDMPDLIVQPAEYEFELKSYDIGGMTFEVVPTPGHSIGSVSFIFDDFVVVGDALFRGSIGRTDLYTGDMQQLLYSIKTYLFTLPRELPAYPGHGEATTIGREIDTNPFFN